MKTLRDFLIETDINLEAFLMGNIRVYEIKSMSDLKPDSLSMNSPPRDKLLTILISAIDNKLYVTSREMKFVKGVNSTTHASIFTHSNLKQKFSSLDAAIQAKSAIPFIGILDTGNSKFALPPSPHSPISISDYATVIPKYKSGEFDDTWGWLNDLFESSFLNKVKSIISSR